jgi:hypothetical protein
VRLHTGESTNFQSRPNDRLGLRRSYRLTAIHDLAVYREKSWWLTRMTGQGRSRGWNAGRIMAFSRLVSWQRSSQRPSVGWWKRKCVWIFPSHWIYQFHYYRHLPRTTRADLIARLPILRNHGLVTYGQRTSHAHVNETKGFAATDRQKK